MFHINKLFPSPGFAERGEEECWRICCFPRVPFSHPRLSMIRRLRRRKQSFLLSLRSVGTTHKGTTSKIIRPLYEQGFELQLMFHPSNCRLYGDKLRKQNMYRLFVFMNNNN